MLKKPIVAAILCVIIVISSTVITTHLRLDSWCEEISEAFIADGGIADQLETVCTASSGIIRIAEAYSGTLEDVVVNSCGRVAGSDGERVRRGERVHGNGYRYALVITFSTSADSRATTVVICFRVICPVVRQAFVGTEASKAKRLFASAVDGYIHGFVDVVLAVLVFSYADAAKHDGQHEGNRRHDDCDKLYS